jgi:hypothetical protein
MSDDLTPAQKAWDEAAAAGDLETQIEVFAAMSEGERAQMIHRAGARMVARLLLENPVGAGAVLGLLHRAHTEGAAWRSRPPTPRATGLSAWVAERVMDGGGDAASCARAVLGDLLEPRFSAGCQIEDHDKVGFGLLSREREVGAVLWSRAERVWVVRYGDWTERVAIYGGKEA